MPPSSSPLHELRDVHLPDPISLWPPAPGWWMIFGVIVAAVIAMLWIRRYRRRTHMHQLAITELGAIKRHYETHKDEQWLVQRLSAMIRRYALATFPRTEVAGLVGISWLQFLDRVGRTNQFTDGIGHLLSSEPYRREAAVSAAELIPVVEQWIRHASLPTERHPV